MFLRAHVAAEALLLALSYSCALPGTVRATTTTPSSHPSEAEDKCLPDYRKDGPISLQLLVVLPLLQLCPHTSGEGVNCSQSSFSVPLWDRGVEILPAGLEAAKRINTKLSLLPGYEVEVIPVNGTPCHVPASDSVTMVEFVKELTRERGPGKVLAGVTGLFCDSHASLISRLAVRNSASKDNLPLLQLSGSSSPVFRHRQDYPQLYRTVSSSTAFCNATLELIRRLGWERVAIIGGLFESVYTTTAQHCYDLFRSNTAINMTYFGSSALFDHSISGTITSLRTSGSRITVLSTDASQAAAILCTAYGRGLHWPKYGWIVYEHTAEELLASRPGECDRDTMEKALEGLVTLHYQLENQRLPSTDYPMEGNVYANILYDSVTVLSLALNQSLAELCFRNYSHRELIDNAFKNMATLRFEGRSGYVSFQEDTREVATPINILHHMDGASVPLGTYFSLNRTLVEKENNSLQSLEILDDDLPRNYSLLSAPITIILSGVISFCLLATTPIFILFIYFRAEPEIKATSPFLSLNLFLGSYLLFACTLINTISSAIVNTGVTQLTVCGAVVWTGSLGVNFIFATLLVRMTRIFYIFNHFGKIGKMWSDWSMFALILVMVSFDAFILLMWSLLDPYVVQDIETYVPTATPPYYSIVQYCYSDYTQIWLGVVFGEVGLLSIAVVILAVMTRKIKRKDFKDTKKVSAYVLVMISVMCLLLPLWWAMRIVGNPSAGSIIIYLGYGTAAVLCQLFLFVPKVITPLVRRFRGGPFPSMETTGTYQVVRSMPSTPTSPLNRQFSYR